MLEGGRRFWADRSEVGVAPYAERADRETNWPDYRIAAGLGALRARLPFQRMACRRRAAQVLALAPWAEALTEAGLRDAADALRPALLREGFTPVLSARAFALIRAATWRHLGMRHHPVQLMGGAAMLDGRLAQMATGEGKTITALLPAVTAGLAGIPVHVVTVNDYLASRDAARLRPVYEALGLSLGLAQHGDEPAARRAAYAANVTYVTNKELTFDYLRDRIARGTGLRGAARERMTSLLGGGGQGGLMLRGLHFAVIDEADSVLVDEARTPLIISAERGAAEAQALSEQALELAGQLAPGRHWSLSRDERKIELTRAGRAEVAWLAAGRGGLWSILRAREELAEQALSALHLFERDRHYIVQDDKVQIVDEFTGRVMADRSWEGGLHQMIEVKEGVTVTGRRETLARITYQRFFRRYRRLAAMTGTGMEVAGELKAEFDLDTVLIPTNRPTRRRCHGIRLWRRGSDRWGAVVARTRHVSQEGRPVLIGTRSVEASELVSELLRAAGLPHRVINARQDADEAAVIAGAGRPGCITVATNMAGRGTDILLDPAVARRGGLHVVLTEFHESARIDRQLFGRAGRQGDPGSYEVMSALEDEIFTRFLPGWFRGGLAGLVPCRRLPPPLNRLLPRLAQGAAERKHAAIRRQQVKADIQMAKALAFAGPVE